MKIDFNFLVFFSLLFKPFKKLQIHSCQVYFQYNGCAPRENEVEFSVCVLSDGV